MTIVITDSTILILLVKLDLFEILYKKYQDLVIPAEIYEETVIMGKKGKKDDSFYIEERVKKNKIRIVNIQNVEKRNQLMKDFGLHKGEAECIVLFLEISANLLGSDDKKTINVCKIFQIPFFSVISFLLLCISEKLMAKSRVLLKLEKLEKIGWYKPLFIETIRAKIEKMEGE